MVSERGADEAALFWSYANLQHINPDLAKRDAEGGQGDHGST